MLNKYQKGFAVAMLAMALGMPNYINAQSINNATLGTQQSKPSGLTLSINDVGAEAAVGLICEHFGYTPMLHMPLEQTVSIDLRNASFDEAMEKVLANTETDYMLEGGRLHVFKPRESWSRFSDQTAPDNSNVAPQKQEEPIITKIVPLGKRTAADIQKLVKELNRKISVVHDVPTNSVIIMGSESEVNAAETLCKSIDGMEVRQTATDTSKLVKGLRYVTQTFELEHADFDEIEEELSTMIERDTNSSTSGSTAAQLRDKDGNPIETEYFMLDKARRIVVVHTTMEKFAVIEAYFKAIDKPLPQVLIEASILAIDDGLDKQLGIKWSGMEGTSGYLAPEQRISTNESLSGLIKYGGKWDFSSVKALLEAVESDDKSQVLSKPRVITVTGKTSSIHVGDDVAGSVSDIVDDQSEGVAFSHRGGSQSNHIARQSGIGNSNTVIENIVCGVFSSSCGNGFVESHIDVGGACRNYRGDCWSPNIRTCRIGIDLDIVETVVAAARSTSGRSDSDIRISLVGESSDTCEINGDSRISTAVISSVQGIEDNEIRTIGTIFEFQRVKTSTTSSIAERKNRVLESGCREIKNKRFVISRRISDGEVKRISVTFQSVHGSAAETVQFGSGRPR